MYVYIYIYIYIERERVVLMVFEKKVVFSMVSAIVPKLLPVRPCHECR